MMAAVNVCATLLIAYAVAFIGIWLLTGWEKWAQARKDQQAREKQKRGEA